MSNRSNPWVVAGVVVGSALLAWNIWRITAGKPYQGGAHHLVFLPDPQVSRAMSMGHLNTTAKLQWMDSFAYFQYQIDVRDDSVAGRRRGAFDRLYTNLVGLDPLFVPYYEYGATALGGLVDDHEAELRLLAHGVHHRPDSTRLWALFASCLKVFFDFADRHPEQMEAVLRSWAAAEHARGSAREYWPQQWIANLGRQHDRGLDQAQYWGRQLLGTTPDSQRGRLAQQLMREQLARYGLRRLEALLAAAIELTGHVPETAAALADAELAAAVYRAQGWNLRLGPADPLVAGADGLRVRTDPYGYEYRIEGAQVVSPGLVHATFARQIATINRRITDAASELGRWPRDLREAFAFAGISPVVPPPERRLRLAAGRVQIEVVGAQPTAWTREELLRAAGLERSAGSGAEGAAEPAEEVIDVDAVE